MRTKLFELTYSEIDNNNNNNNNNNNSLVFFTLASTDYIELIYESTSQNNQYINYKIVIPDKSVSASVTKRVHNFQNNHIYWEFINNKGYEFLNTIVSNYIKYGPSFNIDYIGGYVPNSPKPIPDNLFTLTIIYENNIKLFNVRQVTKEKNNFIIEVQHDKNTTIEPIHSEHKIFTLENRHYHTNYYKEKTKEEYLNENIKIENSSLEFYARDW